MFSFSAGSWATKTDFASVSIGERGGVVASVEICFSDDPALSALPRDEAEDAERIS